MKHLREKKPVDFAKVDQAFQRNQRSPLPLMLKEVFTAVGEPTYAEVYGALNVLYDTDEGIIKELEPYYRKTIRDSLNYLRISHGPEVRQYVYELIYDAIEIYY